MKIIICGLGYVGSTMAACLLRDRHSVVGIDINPGKIEAFLDGTSPVSEPGVDEMLASGISDGRLTAGTCIAALLFVALLSGAIASAVTAREFRFSFASDMWARNLVGGFMMGFGAMMVPGGNAALLLHDLPGLSARALAAYVAMVLGIAISLIVVGRLMGASVTVSCDSDFCKMKKHMPGKGPYGGRFGVRKQEDGDA